jgi:GAF domain-containing protein
MATERSSDEDESRSQALQDLSVAAVDNIRGVEFSSITVYDEQGLRTLAATDPLAERVDNLQYELREGPCYAAVTEDRFVLINDMAASTAFPRYGARATEMGVKSQAAVQLVESRERAGLNLYSGRTGAFDRSTVQLAELFATHAAALLDYATQVEQLSEALHTRTDIGTAVGIVMERYGIDRDQAFAFLVRSSNHRNVKIRLLAREIIGGTSHSDRE